MVAMNRFFLWSFPSDAKEKSHGSGIKFWDPPREAPFSVSLWRCAKPKNGWDMSCFNRDVNGTLMGHNYLFIYVCIYLHTHIYIIYIYTSDYIYMVEFHTHFPLPCLMTRWYLDVLFERNGYRGSIGRLISRKGQMAQSLPKHALKFECCTATCIECQWTKLRFGFTMSYLITILTWSLYNSVFIIGCFLALLNVL